jgi:LysM repeat protein
VEKPETIIHKRGKEEKYSVYLEGYVLSYLQDMAKDEKSVLFYGYKDGRKYAIWGAGKCEDSTFFKEYELLNEISCEWTEEGLILSVDEGNGKYTLNGYDIFYGSNEGMQNCILKMRQEQKAQPDINCRKRVAVEEMPKEAEEIIRRTGRLHGWISMQLCGLFILLCAIVITSTDSYDKLLKLGKTTKEVFFAMENQTVREEGEPTPSFAGREPEEEPWQVPVKNMPEEKTEKPENTEQEETEEEKEADEEKIDEIQPEQEAETDEAQSAGQQNEGDREIAKVDEPGTMQEDTEALSRNLTRYYEVEKGDTLYTICREIYGDLSQVEKICEINGIEDPDEIGYGQKIILP